MNKAVKRTLTIAAILLAIGVVAAAVINHSSSKADKWSELDDFKAGLKIKLASSVVDAGQFNISVQAGKLEAIRIDGMGVCTSEEISAEQYIELAGFNEELVKAYQGVAIQLNGLLANDKGISDCQFRVLEDALSKPTSVK
jgi:hypothetical protein